MALSDPERAHACERVEGESKGHTPAPVTEPCFVYILRCADGSYDVGSTSDVAVRERVHNEGHGAVYTATRRPVRLVYSEAHQSWPAARRREAQLADIEAW
jgi:putative endonuclease